MSWGTDQSSLEVKAATCFAFLCRHGFGLDAAVAFAWWQSLRQSPHSKCRWFVRKLCNYRGSLDGLGPWVLRVIPPRHLVETLDILVAEHRLSQSHAWSIQERVLHLLNADGWK